MLSFLHFTRTGRNIRPMRIQIYTLDREPADKRIEKISLATLQWVANECASERGCRPRFLDSSSDCQAGHRWSLSCGTPMIHVAYSALFSQTTLTNLLL